MLMVMAFLVSACGGGKTSSNPVAASATAATQSYTGPAPTDPDVQSFKLNVWDNLSDQNRCGACHGAGGAGTDLCPAGQYQPGL